MKKLLLALIVAAAAGIVIYKMMNRAAPAPAQDDVTSSASTVPGKPVFYLFHDPADQDEGCRRVYSFADRAEREMAGKIEVKRPDVKNEKGVVDKYQVRVLPTILVVDTSGLLLNAIFNWWWADPLAAMTMVPIIAKEGVEALRGKTCCDGACP